MATTNDYLKGTKSVLPILTGLFPFGLIYGVSAVTSGIPKVQAIAMSFVVFAGAAQISIVNSFASGISIISAVAIAVLINLRMAMYGASIADSIRSDSLLTRAVSSFLLTDQAYAVSIVEKEKSRNTNILKFYMGAAFSIWLTWQAATITGVIAGKTLPSWLSLEFAVPLTFLALLGPFLIKSHFAVSALTAGIVMVLTQNVPYNGGFFIAVLSGIAAGVLMKNRKGDR